jgi:hypothetical protein
MRAADAAARGKTVELPVTASCDAGLVVALTCAVSVLISTSASSVDLHQSRLTTIELASCNRVANDADGVAWTCPGLPGYPVYFVQGRQHQMMSFGPEPEKRQSARQTLRADNSIFDGKRRPTIEWRIERTSDNALVPFATIVRYYTSRGSAKGEVLVITKIAAEQSCQVALVDVRANSHPMALARMWANAHAGRMECPDKPLVLGRHGESPM